MDRLQSLAEQLRRLGREYWATQVEIQKREVAAWSTQAEGKPDEAVRLLRMAADDEDAIEKLPVTPGPIVPAREQLGYMLLEQNRPADALKEFQTALKMAPGRRGALQGAARAGSQSKVRDY
jgi:tetratricopeptide (TPR) repeat protein